MVATYNLTVSTIETLPIPPKGKRTYYADEKERGLALCVTGAGTKTWYVSRWASGTSQRVRLGEYPGIKVDEARRQAAQVNAAVARREDPGTEARSRRQDKTFGEMFAWYLEHHSKPRKRDAGVADARNFKNHLGKLAGRKMLEITRAHVREWHAHIAKTAGPYCANRQLALVANVFTRAIASDQFPGPSPAVGIECFPEHSRDRRLSAAEMKRLHTALAEEPNALMRDFVYMSLLTGARKGNVLAMAWKDIDFDARTWRIPMTKNGKPQLVPLLEAELTILREHQGNGSPWVFPGRSDSASGHLEGVDYAWCRIRARAGLDDVRLHDLRRTLGSWMVDTGASLPVIGGVLHHQSQATTAVYARLSLDPQRVAKQAAHDAMEGTRSALGAESLGTG